MAVDDSYFKLGSMTIGDDDRKRDITTTSRVGLKAIRYKQQKHTEKPSSFTSSGITSMGCPFVVHSHHSSDAARHVTVQTQMLSGDAYNNLRFRVSTNQRELVLTSLMSKNFTSAADAFSFIEGGTEGLDNHPMVIARKCAIGKLQRRETGKRREREQRIPLGFKCHRTFATGKTSLIDGPNFVRYANGEVHLHVEMIVDTGDTYHPDRMVTPLVIDPEQMEIVMENQSPANGSVQPESVPDHERKCSAGALTRSQ